MIRAITGNRLTLNNTLYTTQSLKGRADGMPTEVTGYSSFVLPHGKPIIREHRLRDEQGMFGPGAQGDTPMGRVVFAGYVKNSEGKALAHPNPLYPGYAEGDGFMRIVPMITQSEAIERVLGHVYHTVSIGACVDKIIESISGRDIVAAWRNGEEMPDYIKGQTYMVDGKEKLCYWEMGPIRGRELSFVNEPSDVLAGIERGKEDIGLHGLQMLVGEKRVGTQEFALYDPVTNERIDLGEGLWEPEFNPIESIRVAENTVIVPAAAAASTTEGTPDGAPSITNQNGARTMTKNLGFKEALKTLDPAVNPTQGEAYYEFAVMMLQKEKIEITDEFLEAADSTMEFENPDLFAECTTKAMALMDNQWNKQAAEFAMASYLLQEGKVKIKDRDARPMTFGELYALDGNTVSLANVESTLTFGEYKALADEVFAGEDRTVPITNLVTASFVRNVLGLENDLTRKWGAVESGKLSPVVSTIEGIDFKELNFSSLEQATAIKNDAGDLTESFNGDAKFKEGLEKYAAQLEETPLIGEFLAGKTENAASMCFKTETANCLPQTVGQEFLVEAYKRKEAKNVAREYLALAVGLARKFGVDRETAENLARAYRHFGTPVLERFLSSIPQKTSNTSENSADTGNGEIPAIEQVTDPLLASDNANTGQQEAANESALNWKERVTDSSLPVRKKK
jgi:hypothetical protein